MENRRDDEEAVLFVVGTQTVVEEKQDPSAKRRRLTKAADKGGASSSSVKSTKHSTRSAANPAVAKAVEVAENEEVEAEEPLKRKARKAKVPFYYDKKAFAVSATPAFVRHLEKENWKDFMSFVKENAAPANPLVEESAGLGVVETGLNPPESQEAHQVAPAQDPRPDVVVADAIPQLELRPDVVVEKKSKKSSVGKVASKFPVKLIAQRYVRKTKV